MRDAVYLHITVCDMQPSKVRRAGVLEAVTIARLVGRQDDPVARSARHFSVSLIHPSCVFFCPFPQLQNVLEAIGMITNVRLSLSSAPECAGGHWHDHQDEEEHSVEGLAHGGWLAH